MAEDAGVEVLWLEWIVLFREDESGLKNMAGRYGVVYFDGENDVNLAEDSSMDRMVELAKSVARKHGMSPSPSKTEGTVMLYVKKENAMVVKAVGVVGL